MNLLGNLISQLKAGSMHHKKCVDAKKNKLIIDFCFLLYELGYISSFSVEKNSVRVFFKYSAGRSTLLNIKLLSKSSKKLFVKAQKLNALVKKSSKVHIISTKYGLITGQKAVELNIGGVLLASI
jgi:ribosomal protein S8